MNKTILGRDPALWLALIGTFISGLGAFVLHFTTDQEGALNGAAAALFGALVWRMTTDGLPALILGIAKALILVAAAWHFNIPADQQSILMVFLSAAVAMFVRTQVGSPVPPPDTTAQVVVVVDTPTTPPPA